MNPKKSNVSSGFKLIAGLGNPGPSYARTRHNTGALAVERLARSNKLVFRSYRSFKSLLCEAEIGGREVLLALPQTYMNLSGEAVRALAVKKKIDSGDILIVYDDLALPLGSIRLKKGGGGGGHNGLTSVIEKLGTQEISRLRLGIRTAAAVENMTGFVLARFSREEGLVLERALRLAAEAMGCWVYEGIQPCMNKFNRKPVERESLNHNTQTTNYEQYPISKLQ